MKDKWISAKERWARKMAGQARPTARSTDRLPPGQREVKDFPVLDLGIKPRVPLNEWRLRIHGMVENPVELTWEDLNALPQFSDTSDFHCVTTWSRFDLAWEGVAFFTIAELVKPRAEASHVVFQSYDGYDTNVELDPCMDDDVLIATKVDGAPLPLEHGAPARMVIPKLYAWKSAKFLREIRFTDAHELGYWEKRGYSDTADPWIEDRFRSEQIPPGYATEW
jgi:DMSO/TMAO reductase YedYZ molybdopterin-dependent catalytic subunit